MKYILDSVKRDDIEKWLEIIEGVTSNPILLKAEKMSTFDFLDIMKEYNILRFVQVTTIEEVDEIASRYRDDIKSIVFKVTMHPNYYNLIGQIKYRNFKISATTMYDIVQINQAIEMKLDYTMVYRAKNEYSNLFNDAYKLKTQMNSNIKLVGASFRTKEHVTEAILAGMDYSTIPNKVLDLTFKNYQLNDDIKILYDKN